MREFQKLKDKNKILKKKKERGIHTDVTIWLDQVESN